MKKLIIYSFICVLFFLFSCTWAGSNTIGQASGTLNYSGVLVSKTPLDFDEKFGYKVLVYRYSKDSVTIIDENIFISKNTWERLPNPSDTVVVFVEYINNIEYGRNGSPIVFWDCQFNMCVGYHIDKKTKK